MSAEVWVEAYHGLYRSIQRCIGAQTSREILEPRAIASEVIAGVVDIQQRNKGSRSSGIPVRYEAGDGRWAATPAPAPRRPAPGLFGRSLDLQIGLILELVSQLATPYARNV